MSIYSTKMLLVQKNVSTTYANECAGQETCAGKDFDIYFVEVLVDFFHP